MVLVQLLCVLIQLWSIGGDYKTMRLKHETITALSGEQMNEVQKNIYIHIYLYI